MKYVQRDIVEVNFLLPSGKMKPHMALVVSNDELQADDDILYLALISSKNYLPKYTYPLKNEMLSKPLSKQSYVVCQIISGYTERDILKKCSRVSTTYFDEIVKKIKKSIF
jgi:mRNA-degrading endonuclease toxin of MazEF toxin-antitoxin module